MKTPDPRPYCSYCATPLVMMNIIDRVSKPVGNFVGISCCFRVFQVDGFLKPGGSGVWDLREVGMLRDIQNSGGGSISYNFQPITRTGDTMSDKVFDRAAIGGPECQVNPIFLLQSKHIIIYPNGQWEWDSDMGSYYDSLKGKPGEDGVGWQSGAEILAFDSDYGFAYWLTESVWATREEAEQFGEKTKYRYCEGWKVYCVSADGQLAEMLKGSIKAPA